MIDSPAKQSQLVRSLGLFSVFILTVSSVIGSGIYKKVAPMSAELLSPHLVLICWILAGVISLFGALSNAEVAGLLADSGGEYAYYKKMYNRFFAFLFGWTNFAVIRSASVASIAYVFAQSFNSLISLPQLPADVASISLFGVFSPFDNFGVKLLTIFLILVLSYVNFKGLRFGEGLSKWITLMVVASIFMVIILGLTIGGGSLTNFNTPATGYVEASWLDPRLITQIFTALLAAFWAYEGWSSVGYLGGEIKNVNRTLPLALVMGVSFIILVYVSINFTYLYILPIDEIIDVQKSQNTIAAIAVVKHFLGSGGGLMISILILFTTFGATNSTILPPPRLYYAMAKEGMFFKSAAKIHPTYNTPYNGLWIQALWSCALVLSGSFDQLTDMLIFASFIFYGATTVGVFVLRIKMPDVPRPYKAWGYPVVPAIFILFCVALIIITFASRPREAFIGLALILSGLPFYYYWNKRSPEEKI
jgi:basic amino acid/polyamine antiporter, APA family